MTRWALVCTALVALNSCSEGGQTLPLTDAGMLLVDEGTLDQGVEVRDASGQDSGPLVDFAVISQSGLPQQIVPGAELDAAVTVQNLGASVSPVTELRVDLRTPGASDDEARLLALETVDAMAAGATQQLMVSFRWPEDLAPGAYEVQLVVDAFDAIAEADESKNRLTVPTAVPGTRVTPAELRFSRAVLGCVPRAEAVVVQNIATSPARIVSASLVTTNPAFTLEALTLPTTVEPSAEQELLVTYAPLDVAEHRDVLEVVVEQGDTVVHEVPIVGNAVATGTLTETFDFTGAKMDVLFVINVSSSIQEEQDALANQWSTFETAAFNRGIDWQLGATTADVEPTGEQGRFLGVPPILTAQTPNAAALFAERVTPGTTGSPRDSGIHASFLALSPPLDAMTNRGFLRPGASLVVVYLADQDDDSPEPLSFYQDFFRSLKPASQIRIHNIIGPVGRCSGAGGSAQDCVQHRAFEQGFSNLETNICGLDYTAPLSDFGSVGGSQSYVLANDAAAGSLRVWVDDVEIPEFVRQRVNWAFEPPRTVVLFPQVLPRTQATVTVEYVPMCGS